VLDICAEQGVRLTFFMFPTDDTESMNNVGKLFLYGGDSVDYVIVHNPAKARGDLFKGSQLEKRLLDYGARQSRCRCSRDHIAGGGKRPSHRQTRFELCRMSRTEAGHMERLLAGEIQWAMQKMFRQYAAIADLLLRLN